MTDVLATLLVIIILMYAFTGNQRDSTDDGDKRSGMRVHTDHKTGVQYVGTFFSLTPRLKADGTLHTVKDEAQ